MLPLAYGSDVPRPILEIVEHHARALGLSLADLEVAGRDLATAEAFILAVERGDVSGFAERFAAAPRAAPSGPVAA